METYVSVVEWTVFCAQEAKTKKKSKSEDLSLDFSRRCVSLRVVGGGTAVVYIHPHNSGVHHFRGVIIGFVRQFCSVKPPLLQEAGGAISEIRFCCLDAGSRLRQRRGESVTFSMFYVIP